MKSALVMAREHEDTPVASGAVIRNRKNHVRSRKRAKKQPQDPFASNYGQVPFTKVPAGSLTEEGDLREAAVGRSVVFFGTVRAIRPVSNTMAVVVLHRNLSTERCVVVAGAFAGITRRVRFATTLFRHSLVIVDGVVSISKSTQQVGMQVSDFFASFYKYFYC